MWTDDDDEDDDLNEIQTDGNGRKRHSPDVDEDNEEIIEMEGEFQNENPKLFRPFRLVSNWKEPGTRVRRLTYAIPFPSRVITYMYDVAVVGGGKYL